MTKITFIQLFQLYRLLKSQPSIHSEKWLPTDLRANNIVSWLNRHRGLTHYLSNHFTQTDIPIIQMLFDDASIVHSDELASVTFSCNIGSDVATADHEYQRKFWKQNDLVIHALQYLRLDDLDNCSLVCSIWLYAAFNPLCLHNYKLLYPLYPFRGKINGGKDLTATQCLKWQRLQRIRYTALRWYFLCDCEEMRNISLQLCWLKNVIMMEICVLQELFINALIAINEIKNQLLMFKIEFIGSGSRGRNLSNVSTTMMLHLPNANFVSFRDSSNVDLQQPPMTFPIVISDKCKTLHVEHATFADTWYKNQLKIITANSNKNTACLNVKSLMLASVKIQNKIEIKNQQQCQLCVNQMASLFQHVQWLSLREMTDDMMNLWLAMKPSLIFNDAQISIEPIGCCIFERYRHKPISRKKLAHFVIENGLEIHGLVDFIHKYIQNTTDRFHSQERVNLIQSLKSLLRHSCKKMEFWMWSIGSDDYKDLSWENIFCRESTFVFDRLQYFYLEFGERSCEYELSLKKCVDILDFVNHPMKSVKTHIFFKLRFEGSIEGATEDSSLSIEHMKTIFHVYTSG